jgi:hypothetical protein
MDLDDDINDIICYKNDPTKADWKVALPESMLADWRQTVVSYVEIIILNCHQLKCRECQKYKLAGHGMVYYLKEKCGLHLGKKSLYT